MCRFLPPPGRQQNRTANLRYLVFFEIRKKMKKIEKNKNIKNIKDVSLFAASGMATIWQRDPPLPNVFLIFAENLKKMKNAEM